MSWIKSLGRVVKSVIPVLVFNAPDTGYIKPTFILFFRLQCKRGTTPKNEHGNSKMDLWKMKILFRGVWVFRGCKSKRNSWKSSRPLEKIGHWKCWWNESLLKFHGLSTQKSTMTIWWSSPLDPQDECVKKPIGPSTKTDYAWIRLPLWWNLAPIQVSWDFRFPESFFFFVVVVVGELGCDFFVDDQILPESFAFFVFQKRGLGVSLFWILHQCSKNWNHASERCFCLPLTWRNK